MARVFGMKKSQQNTAGLQDLVDALDHWLDQGFIQIIRNIPAKNGIELAFRIIQVFAKEFRRIQRFRAIFLPDEKRLVLRGAEHVYVVNASAEAGEKSYVSGRGGSQIKDRDLVIVGKRT